MFEQISVETFNIILTVLSAIFMFWALAQKKLKSAAVLVANIAFLYAANYYALELKWVNCGMIALAVTFFTVPGAKFSLFLERVFH